MRGAPAAGLLASLSVFVLSAAALPLPVVKLTASVPGTDSGFGGAVAVDGEWMAVGASYAKVGIHRPGAVDLFRQAGGAWTFHTRLTPATTHVWLSAFGGAVALEGDTLAVGAPGLGQVTVYRWDGAAWGLDATLASPSGGTADRFAYSVAVRGNVIAVGAPQATTAQVMHGAVDVFRRTAGTWSHEERLTPSGVTQGVGLGTSVDVDGHRVVAGAPLADGAMRGTGAAYLFERGPSGWAQAAVLAAADGVTNDQFGRAVAVDGDIAAVGSYWDDTLLMDGGSAYVFRRAAGAWAQDAKLVPPTPNPLASSGFGWALALSGTRLAVGAMHEVGNTGAAYVFVDTPAGWTCGAKLVAYDPQPGKQYGAAVALDGSTLVVGAPTDDGMGPMGSHDGAVYHYPLPAVPGVAAPDVPSPCEGL